MSTRPLTGVVSGFLLLVAPCAGVASAQAAGARASVLADAHLSDSAARARAVPNRPSVVKVNLEHGEHRTTRIDTVVAPATLTARTRARARTTRRRAARRTTGS